MEPTLDTLTSPPELTPLEQEVLEEYERLSENMKKVRDINLLPPPCHLWVRELQQTYSED